MNYTEKYEVRKKTEDGWVSLPLDSYSEADAIEYMDLEAQGPGVWKVVRVMEVTVASVVRA
ncbi:hypothetical protein [Streptomyces sp. NPDC006355]|uniref:hypothetical protein n=1 Tax=Streptomyces sp. NPDC006355 TaxID=3156758 RepID=UPI0033BD7383